MKTTRSSRLFTRALNILPGGVDSPVRAFKSVGASPLFIRRASGAYIEDVDGNRFIDYVMSWGPLIHGHAPRGVIKALAAVTRDGTRFGANRGKIAAVIVEPIAGNIGVVPPADGFLQRLRQLCTADRTLLIFDEVISGFRASAGGAQEVLRVIPDLTCLGKIIGGGLP